MRRREVLRLLIAACTAGPAISVRPAAAHKERSALTPTAGRQTVKIPAPEFTLTDEDEHPFSFRSWRGRVVLVTFGFTRCVDVCPLLTANLAVIQREMPAERRERTGFLLITTDPEYDTPPILREYGGRFAADFSSWKFLTGRLEDLAAVWKAFGVAVKKSSSAGVDHTTLTTIVDPEGIRRINYYGTRWRPQGVLRDLRSLL